MGHRPGASRRTAIAYLRADLARYREDWWLPRSYWLVERSVWAVLMYRLGQRVLEIENRLIRKMARLPAAILAMWVEGFTGIEIPPHATIGPGMRIYHGQGIVISASSRIGERVILRQGVTIGNRRNGDGACPVIGDGVEFGAYAQVLGGITIGEGARVGTFSVVMDDVSAGATVVGIPARIVRDTP